MSEPLPGPKHVKGEVMFTYAVKAYLYRGVQVELHSFLTSELDGSIIIIIIYLFTAIGLSPGGSGYFTCKQNMKLVTTEFK